MTPELWVGHLLHRSFKPIRLNELPGVLTVLALLTTAHTQREAEIKLHFYHDCCDAEFQIEWNSVPETRERDRRHAGEFKRLKDAVVS